MNSIGIRFFLFIEILLEENLPTLSFELVPSYGGVQHRVLKALFSVFVFVLLKATDFNEMV